MGTQATRAGGAGGDEPASEAATAGEAAPELTVADASKGLQMPDLVKFVTG